MSVDRSLCILHVRLGHINCILMIFLHFHKTNTVCVAIAFHSIGPLVLLISPPYNGWLLKQILIIRVHLTITYRSFGCILSVNTVYLDGCMFLNKYTSDDLNFTGTAICSLTFSAHNTHFLHMSLISKWGCPVLVSVTDIA